MDTDPLPMVLRSPRWRGGVVGGILLALLGVVFVLFGATAGFRFEGALAVLGGAGGAWSSTREQLTIDATGVALRGVVRVRRWDWGAIRSARLVQRELGLWSVEVTDQSGQAHLVRSVGARGWRRRSVDGSNAARAVSLINGRVGFSETP